jgi:hypothetical protein
MTRAHGQSSALIVSIVSFSILASGCTTSMNCGSNRNAPLLEIHYVFDPYGGAPVISTAQFLPCGRLQLETVGKKPKLRHTSPEAAESIQRVLKDQIFWRLLRDAKPTHDGFHGSFIAVASPENIVDKALPGLQFEVYDIPPELRRYLVSLEQSIRATFPEHGARLLQPSLAETPP